MTTTAKSQSISEAPSFQPQVPTKSIVPDDRNRPIATDEEFQGLTDSIRVLGVLQPLHVLDLGAGQFCIADGERRWRAASGVGLAVVPCLIWPQGSNRRDVVAAGIAMNEHRVAHSCLQLARRLRQMKNEFAESQEALAKRTGIPLLRVKFYLSLFDASDHLLTMFESTNVVLGVAVEFVRYEKATSEVESRQLVQRHLKAPLSVRELASLRKNRKGNSQTTPEDPGEHAAPREAPRGIYARLAAALERDPEAALGQLRTLLGKFGYELQSAPGKRA